MAENNYKQAYKSCAKSVQEMRTKRHDVTVELRKSKRDDQLLKRRNIDIEADDATSPLKENNAQSPGNNLTLEEIFQGMESTDDSILFVATQAARKMLSRERNPPIDIMVGHGLVPLCTKFLERFDHPDLQFEAAWALTNVASGTSEQTLTVVNANAIPQFIRLLSSPAALVAEQAVWALGNIAGDGPVTRDIVLTNNCVEGLLKLVQNNPPISFLRNIVWLMSNLCRNKNPPPPFEKIRLMLPVLCDLLKHDDVQVLTDASWAISYISDEDNKKIQAVIDSGCVPHLVALLDLDENAIIVPALRSVGNIVTGDDTQTDAVIAAGALRHMSKLLKNSKNNIVKEAAWTVSNVTAGNTAQLQSVLDTDIFVHIAHVLEHGDFRSQKEAAYVVTNATTSGTPEQVCQLIDSFQILKPFCSLLDGKDPRTVRIVLNGLTSLMQLADKMGSTEQFCFIIEQIGALDKLELLQNHANEDVYKIAYSLIDTYFHEENDKESQLQPPVVGAELEFNSEQTENFNGFKF